MTDEETERMANLTRRLADTAIDYKQRCEELDAAFTNLHREYHSRGDFIAELESERSKATGHALALATTLHRNFYKTKAPHWEPLEDVIGIMFQIDNMTTGLADRIEELEAKLRKSALQELSALGQASEAYQAQLAAEEKLSKCEALLAKAVEEAEKYARAFAAQSRKLQAVLHIEGVKATLAELNKETPHD